jgi:hypothetical protein
MVVHDFPIGPPAATGNHVAHIHIMYNSANDNFAFICDNKMVKERAELRQKVTFTVQNAFSGRGSTSGNPGTQTHAQTRSNVS